MTADWESCQQTGNHVNRLENMSTDWEPSTTDWELPQHSGNQDNGEVKVSVLTGVLKVDITSFNLLASCFCSGTSESTAASRMFPFKSESVSVLGDGPQNFKRLLIVPLKARQLNQRIHGAHNPSKTWNVVRSNDVICDRQTTDSLPQRPLGARERGEFSAQGNSSTRRATNTAHFLQHYSTFL